MAASSREKFQGKRAFCCASLAGGGSKAVGLLQTQNYKHGGSVSSDPRACSVFILLPQALCHYVRAERPLIWQKGLRKTIRLIKEDKELARLTDIQGENQKGKDSKNVAGTCEERLVSRILPGGMRKNCNQSYVETSHATEQKGRFPGSRARTAYMNTTRVTC